MTGRRKSGDERRVEIVAAVLRLLGERGIAALTTAAVAEAVGVSGGALFRHFASREEILAATVDHALDRVAATFPAADEPPLARLLGLAGSRVRLLAGEPGLAWLLRSDEAQLALPAPAVEALRGMARRSRGYLLAALRDGAADGSIRGDVPAEDLLVVVLGTIHTLAGLAGAHRGAAAADPDRVLGGLARLLAPPSPRREPS